MLFRVTVDSSQQRSKMKALRRGPGAYLWRQRRQTFATCWDIHGGRTAVGHACPVLWHWIR